MGINIRAKGAGAEREVAKALDAIVQRVAHEHGREVAGACVQRNQNQTAVGGCDLSNTFGLAIEVKRHEQLSINSWWKQCCEQAKRNDELPVLLFRQSHQKWRVITQGMLPLMDETDWHHIVPVRVEVSWESFLAWFEIWVQRKISEGNLPRS